MISRAVFVARVSAGHRDDAHVGIRVAHVFADGAAWILRPIVWFVAASMVTTILHELAHASVAFALGVRSTLFNYSASLDLTPAQADTNLPVLIRLAGPVFCLGLGLLSWGAFRRARPTGHGDAQLPLPSAYRRS